MTEIIYMTKSSGYAEKETYPWIRIIVNTSDTCYSVYNLKYWKLWDKKPWLDEYCRHHGLAKMKNQLSGCGDNWF